MKVVKREAELFLREGVRDWDKWEGYSSGMDTWSVGGGECTAHVICSMQSTVLPLPFTRILKGKNDEINGKGLPLIKKEKEQICIEKQIKVEPPEQDSKEQVVSANDENDLKDKADETKEMKMDEDNPEQDKAIKAEESAKKEENKDANSEKCNGPKENQSSKYSVQSQRVNRLNNAKSGKLDEILKRIKKEPIGNNNPKESKKDGVIADNMDSKKLLDMVFKKETPSDDKHNENRLKESNRLDKINIKGEMKEMDVDAVQVVARYPAVRLERREHSKYKKESAGGGAKRPYDDLEEEAWSPDEASLSTTNEGQDWLARRVMCVGTVIRNLSFVPGNDEVMSKCAPLLALLGKTILLHHEHPPRSPSTAHYDRDEEGDLGDWCSSLSPDSHWWWPYLHHVHENTLVTLANMSGNLDLSYYPEEITLPLLDGLLHWATCPASYGQDPLPGGGTSPQSSLSPQRLALEALVKLCVLDQNTDLVLATPPFTRLDALCSQLTRMLCRREDQVLREFAVNLLHYFSAADSGVARVIAMQNGCVSLLVAFIEEAEAAAMNVANVQGVSALKENPELMGTSLDMVRRSANTLVHLSRVPDNSCVLAAYENRLLTLVMSQILDTYVASQLSQVLFNVAQVQNDHPPPIPSPPSSPISSPEPGEPAQETTESSTETQSKVTVNHTDANALSINTNDSPKTSTQVSPASNVSKDLNNTETESGYVSSTTTTSSDSSSTSSTLTISAHSPIPPSTPTESVATVKCESSINSMPVSGVANTVATPSL